MPRPIKFTGRVREDGTPSKACYNNWLASLQPFAGREVQCETRDGLRSNSANNYYWGFVVPPVQRLFNEAGYALTDNETHDWLKREFLGVRMIEVPSADLQTVEVREVVGSTRTDAWTFSDYVAAIQAHEPFVEQGLFIPEPEGKLRGRTIHEPGGTKLTFPEAREEPEPAPETDEHGQTAVERATSQALAMGLDDISSLFSNHE